MSQIHFDAFLLHQQIVWLFLSKKDYLEYWYVRSKLAKLCLFWPTVDLEQVWILFCIEKEPSGIADIAPRVSTIRMMVKIVFIIGRFSSSLSWNVLQISRKSTGIDYLKIACMRWSSLFNRNRILKLSIPLMNQLC